MAEQSSVLRHPRWTLAVVCAARSVLLLDVTAVAVALSDIQADFDADLGSPQWVVDGPGRRWILLVSPPQVHAAPAAAARSATAAAVNEILLVGAVVAAAAAVFALIVVPHAGDRRAVAAAVRAGLRRGPRHDP